MTEGLRAKDIDRSDIHHAILAGGSSLWLFVREILEEELSLDSSKIMRSERPYATISEGISLQPGMQRRFRAKQPEMRSDLTRFRDEQLKPHLERRSREFARSVARELASELFDKRIKPELIEFRSHGGTVADLKNCIHCTSESVEGQLRESLGRDVTIWLMAVCHEMQELHDEWFAMHEIAPPILDVDAEQISNDTISPTDVDVPDFYRYVVGASGLVARGCVVSLASLTMSHPVGTVASILLGATAYASVDIGIEKAKKASESWRVPTWLRKAALRDGKINRIRQDYVSAQERLVRQELQKVLDTVMTSANDRIELEIDALSDVNQLA